MVRPLASLSTLAHPRICRWQALAFLEAMFYSLFRQFCVTEPDIGDSPVVER
jgi:hypothetical protein